MILLENRRPILQPEEVELSKVAEELGIPVRYEYLKNISRHRKTVEGCVVVAGSVAFVHHALRHHDRGHPSQNTYPNGLERFMHREILGLSTLRRVKERLEAGGRFFVKPWDTKLFTGFVADNAYDPRFNGAGLERGVYMVESVTFVSEWRCYILDGKLLAVVYATGDDRVHPDRAVIKEAIGVMNSRPVQHLRPVGYALDFGVLDNGKTALVEFNDGYSLGYYQGFNPRDYWNLITARWRQMATA